MKLLSIETDKYISPSIMSGLIYEHRVQGTPGEEARERDRYRQTEKDMKEGSKFLYCGRIVSR